MTIYYLDSSLAAASDSNAGTSETQPFRTLAALSRTFQPGDTIAIKAGTTYTGTLTITADGTASAPVTFTRYGAGSDPVISTTGQTAINMQGANYVVVDHIGVGGATNNGVSMDANSAHDTLQNVEVSKVGFGFLLTGSHDNFLTGNYVHDLHMINNTPGGNDDFGAVAFDLQSSANNELSFNKVVNAKAPSYDYGMDGGGFEFWRSASNILIHDNVVLDSEGFVEAGGLGDNVNNIQVYNNVSANNSIFSWLHNNTNTTFGVNITGFNVHNNTIYEPSAWYISGFDGPVASGSFSFTNNLVYASQSGQAFNQSGTFHTDNFYQAAVTPSGVGEVGGTISFADPAANDFHVTSGAASAYGAYAGSTPPPPPPPPPPPVTTHQLVLALAEDRYRGDAQFIAKVDGARVGGGTVTALERLGASQNFTFSGQWAAGTHDVEVDFINDRYGGTTRTDRNLYVDNVRYDGVSYLDHHVAMLSNGAVHFTVGSP